MCKHDKMDWRARALAATQGSRFGAILRCALNVERDAIPRFEGAPSLTSDGFLLCNFVDRNGNLHWGAFVGSADDVARNLEGLCAHLRMTRADARELADALRQWVNT